jgi:hypothetical protein
MGRSAKFLVAVRCWVVGVLAVFALLGSAAAAQAASRVITGKVTSPIVVKGGESVELTSTALTGAVTVEPNGELNVEGATMSGPLKANGAALLRLCGAQVFSSVEATNGSGSVAIIGSLSGGATGCPYSVIGGAVTIKGNMAGVLINNIVIARLTVTGNAGGTTVTNNLVLGPLTVTGNAGGTTVTNNLVWGGPLTVTGNTGTVVDKPNTVLGPYTSELQ